MKTLIVFGCQCPLQLQQVVNASVELDPLEAKVGLFFV